MSSDAGMDFYNASPPVNAKQRKSNLGYFKSQSVSERIYNPITAIEFLAMFTFQLDITKR